MSPTSTMHQSCGYRQSTNKSFNCKLMGDQSITCMTHDLSNEVYITLYDMISKIPKGRSMSINNRFPSNKSKKPSRWVKFTEIGGKLQE